MIEYGEIITTLKQKGNYRQFPSVGYAERDNLIDFTSNDYLGLARRSDLREAFYADPMATDLPLSAVASRLLALDQDVFRRLEESVEALYANRCALLFNSGYHANTGMLQALADRDTLIVADRLVHASIIDGIRLSRAEFTRFRHNDFGQLRDILKREKSSGRHLIVVVESVYSMDGDMADMEELIRLKKEFPHILLYVDEAHAFGVEGPGGCGLVAASSEPEAFDVVMATLGKAVASVGAFALISSKMKEYLINTARSLIFSTALPPINCAWSRFIIERLSEFDNQRAHLKRLAAQLNHTLSTLSGGEVAISSHIQPLIIGSAERTVALSGKLREEGIMVLPIRTPTVPSGTERLRISLSAAHTSEEVALLCKTLEELS